MLELEENKRFLNNLKIKLEEIYKTMKIDSLKEELEDLRNQSLAENFWQDAENSSKVFGKIKSLEKKLNSYEALNSELNNLLDMNELLEIDPDKDLINDLLKSSNSLENKLDSLEVETYFSGKYDANNAIITLHPRSWWNRISRLGTDVI